MIHIDSSTCSTYELQQTKNILGIPELFHLHIILMTKKKFVWWKLESTYYLSSEQPYLYSDFHTTTHLENVLWWGHL